MSAPTESQEITQWYELVAKYRADVERLQEALDRSEANEGRLGQENTRLREAVAAAEAIVHLARPVVFGRPGGSQFRTLFQAALQVWNEARAALEPDHA